MPMTFRLIARRPSHIDPYPKIPMHVRFYGPSLFTTENNHRCPIRFGFASQCTIVTCTLISTEQIRLLMMTQRNPIAKGKRPVREMIFEIVFTDPNKKWLVAKRTWYLFYTAPLPTNTILQRVAAINDTSPAHSCHLLCQARSVLLALFRHYINIPPSFLALPNRSAFSSLWYSNQIVNTTRTAHSRSWSRWWSRGRSRWWTCSRENWCRARFIFGCSLLCRGWGVHSRGRTS